MSRNARAYNRASTYFRDDEHRDHSRDSSRDARSDICDRDLGRAVRDAHPPPGAAPPAYPLHDDDRKRHRSQSPVPDANKVNRSSSSHGPRRVVSPHSPIYSDEDAPPTPSLPVIQTPPPSATFLKTLPVEASSISSSAARTITRHFSALNTVLSPPGAHQPRTLTWSHLVDQRAALDPANAATVQLREILHLMRDFLGTSAPASLTINDKLHSKCLVDFGTLLHRHLSSTVVTHALVTNLATDPDILCQFLALPFRLGSWGPPRTFYSSLMVSLSAQPSKGAVARAVVNNIEDHLRAAHTAFTSGKYERPDIVTADLMDHLLTTLRRIKQEKTFLGSNPSPVKLRTLADIGAALLRAQLRAFEAVSSRSDSPDAINPLPVDHERNLNSAILTIEVVTTLLLQNDNPLSNDLPLLTVHPCLPLMVNLSIIAGLPLINSRFSMTATIAHSFFRFFSTTRKNTLERVINFFGEAIFRAITLILTSTDTATHTIINYDASCSFPTPDIPIPISQAPKRMDTVSSFFQESPLFSSPEGRLGQRMLIPSHVERFIDEHQNTEGFEAFTRWGIFIPRLRTNYAPNADSSHAHAPLTYTWLAGLTLIDMAHVPNHQADLQTFLSEICPGATSLSSLLPTTTEGTNPQWTSFFACYGAAALSYIHSKFFHPKNHTQMARFPFEWITAVPDLLEWYVTNKGKLLPADNCPFGPLPANDQTPQAPPLAGSHLTPAGPLQHVPSFDHAAAAFRESSSAMQTQMQQQQHLLQQQIQQQTQALFQLMALIKPKTPSPDTVILPVPPPAPPAAAEQPSTSATEPVPAQPDSSAASAPPAPSVSIIPVGSAT